MATRAPSGPSEPPPVGLSQRRASQARRVAAARSLQRFVRQEQWNGLSPGDVVRVAGHPARGRHWRFRAHVTNTSNGASWVEVALVEGAAPTRAPKVTVPRSVDGEPPLVPGARARVEKIRSVDPASVTPRWPPRRLSPKRREPRQGAGRAGRPGGDIDESGAAEPGAPGLAPPPPEPFEQRSLF